MPGKRTVAGGGVALLALCLIAPAVHAQVERSGGGNASAQLYQDYQQAVAERTQLQADNAKLKQQLADAQQALGAAKQQLAAAQASSRGGDARLQAAQAAAAASNKSLETLRAQTQELVMRFRQTITTLRDIESDRAQLRTQLADSRSAFQQCARVNDQLYQVDNEVLDRYARQGMFAYLSRREPFTQIERTRISNAVLEYRQRAEELHLTSAAKPSQADSASGKSAPAPQPP
jgi:chromosome segregation ATPase